MSTLPRKRQKKYFIANKFLRVGAPLVAMVLVGFGGITHLLEGRREVQRAKEDEDWLVLQTSKNISRDGPLEGGTLPRPKLNLEDELKLSTIMEFNAEFGFFASSGWNSSHTKQLP